ncbi:hypothetical protein [Actinoalloteichus caeruleus]|uniref:hypothetical protein n=1 Tax=Actinoalloteichus cyanogriseus TaxID=2893586 RepID=UPI003BB95B64
MTDPSRRPVRRYWAFGLTFRWVENDGFVVVKRGYVDEGSTVIQVHSRQFPVQDRPGETAGHDQAGWLATIPTPAARWYEPTALSELAAAWAAAHSRSGATGTSRALG